VRNSRRSLPVVCYAATPPKSKCDARQNRKIRSEAVRLAMCSLGGSMMIRKTALFVATLFAAGTAFAFHCPQDMKKIDDAMAKNPKLQAAQIDEVKKYRTEGEALHKSGKHQESLDTLAKAMKILDVK
jgi:hypothetical protein